MRFGALPGLLAAAAVAAALTTEMWTLSVAYSDAQACRNTLPALEETGGLIVGGLRRDTALPAVYEIDYWVSGEGARPGRLRCAFGERADGGRRLIGLEIAGRPVSEAQLFLLDRFWLGDEDTVNEGLHRLRDVIPLRERLAAVVGRPDPSFLAAIGLAVLAAAVAALARRRQKPPRH